MDDRIVSLDDTDLAILGMLQDNARVANAEIARRVDMAPSAVYERIRKLEDRGLIRGYEARLGARELGYGLVAFVFVRTADRPGTHSTGDALAALPQVQEVHHVAGEDCFLLKVRAADTEGLGLLLRDLGAIPTVTSTRTTIVLHTLKETALLPLPGREEAAKEEAQEEAAKEEAQEEAAQEERAQEKRAQEELTREEPAREEVARG